MDPLLTLIIRDWKAMVDAAKISPRVPSTCAQNAILFLLIIYIIRSRQISVAIGNPQLVPSVSCLTTSSHLGNDVREADNISHAENLQKQQLPVRFSFVQTLRRDPSYPRVQVLW
jgi:hypothetical protein